VDATRPQRTRAIQKYLEKGSGARNMDNGLQVQLKKDGGWQHQREREGVQQSVVCVPFSDGHQLLKM